MFGEVRLSLLFTALVLLPGCAGAPVQVLSDTRQTLSAAAAAGAADKAPAPYGQALSQIWQRTQPSGASVTFHFETLDMSPKRAP